MVIKQQDLLETQAQEEVQMVIKQQDQVIAQEIEVARH
jgi:hypothetical protein